MCCVAFESILSIHPVELDLYCFVFFPLRSFNSFQNVFGIFFFILHLFSALTDFFADLYLYLTVDLNFFFRFHELAIYGRIFGKFLN